MKPLLLIVLALLPGCATAARTAGRLNGLRTRLAAHNPVAPQPKNSFQRYTGPSLMR